MKKKPSAADRPQFRRDLAKMLGDLKAEVGEVTPETVILCSRAADFDPAHNVLWEQEANKSHPREGVVCSFCRSAVVLSNDAFGRYSALDKKPVICCMQCLPQLATA